MAANILQELLGLMPEQDYPMQRPQGQIIAPPVEQQRMPAGKVLPPPALPQPSSPVDKALEAKAAADVLAPKTTWPLSLPVFQDLMQRSSPGLDAQKKGISEIEQQLKGYDTNINPWIAGAGAISDILNGSNNLGSLISQKEKKELGKAQLTEKLQKSRNDLADKEIDLFKAQFQNPFAMDQKNSMATMLAMMNLGGRQDSDLTKSIIDLYRIQSQAANAGAKGGGAKTPGMDTFNRETAKSLSTWSTDRDAANSTVMSLRDVVGKLRQDPSLSGGVMAKVPGGSSDYAQQLFNPKGAEIQRAVQATVADVLKSKLGSQFTQKDREVLEKLQFNPRMSADSNIEAITKAINVIQSKIDEQENKYEHFQSHGGDMSGFKLNPLKSSTPQGGAKPMSFEEWKKAKGK